MAIGHVVSPAATTSTTTNTTGEYEQDENVSNPLAVSFSRRKLSPTSIKRSCFFCGGKIHPRNLCPARGIACHSCGKIGHYFKVCKSQKSRSTTATLFTTNLCAITTSVPESLASATTSVT